MFCRRNYITGSAAAVEYSAGQQPEPRNAGGQRSSGNVDLMLRAIDARIKKYIVVHKRDVEEVLQAVMEKGIRERGRGALIGVQHLARVTFLDR